LAVHNFSSGHRECSRWPWRTRSGAAAPGIRDAGSRAAPRRAARMDAAPTIYRGPMTEQIAKDTCIVRNTAAEKGRTHAVVPGKTASKYLYYGRIILDAGGSPMKFDTKEKETGLICLKGSATVRTGDQSFSLKHFDSLYVPRDRSIEVVAGPEGCDLAEVAAPVGRACALT